MDIPERVIRILEFAQIANTIPKAIIASYVWKAFMVMLQPVVHHRVFVALVHLIYRLTILLLHVLYVFNFNI